MRPIGGGGAPAVHENRWLELCDSVQVEGGCVASHSICTHQLNKHQRTQVIEIGYLNGLFVLARSIGLIGHALDQKRLQQPLYRHPWEDVL